MGNIWPWSSNKICINAIAENEKKRQARFNEVKTKCADQDTNLRDEILALSLIELQDALQNDRYTASRVLLAYAWKAMQVQDQINCVIEFLIESFEEARVLDEKYFNKSNKPPLFGIPFSVKGNFYLKGYDCSIGLGNLLNQPQNKDCTMVTFLRMKGAVPFVYSNVPQALLSFVCSNSVYGTTKNPHNYLRSPGGSSGGEGAIVAAGGTPFGTGSDLAGSLRIPANMCGVVALKPTEGRLIVNNTHPGVPGRGRLALSFGFFTKNVEEQISLLNLIVGDEEYRKLSPKTSPLKLNKELIYELSNKKLKIGYFLNDGFLLPAPACGRVVQETVEKLRGDGHEMIAFRVPNSQLMAEVIFKSIALGGDYMLNLYNNDVVDVYSKRFVTMLKIPYSIRYVASFFLRSISPQMSIMARGYLNGVDDVRYTFEQIDDYIQEFTEYWQELGIDALVCPSFPVPPPPHEYPSQIGGCCISTALWNLLDWPAGVVPTGVVTKQDDDALLDEKQYPVGNNIFMDLTRKASKNSAGLPLSVQIVAPPYQEELCLSLMKQVEALWK